MEILYLLIPLSVGLVFIIGIVFWWSVRSGQFDDLEGPAYRILMDDDRPQQQHDAPADAAAPQPSADAPGSGVRRSATSGDSR